MKDFEPDAYPPPDLAIEVDITRRSIAREPIYAALGVPELWRYDGKRLHVLKLTAAGTYEVAAASLSFPFLPMADFERFVKRMLDEEQTKVLREFRDWVRKLPR
jgi:Uma2 family endonuclease